MKATEILTAISRNILDPVVNKQLLHLRNVIANYTDASSITFGSFRVTLEGNGENIYIDDITDEKAKETIIKQYETYAKFFMMGHNTYEELGVTILRLCTRTGLKSEECCSAFLKMLPEVVTNNPDIAKIKQDHKTTIQEDTYKELELDTFIEEHTKKSLSTFCGLLLLNI